MGKVLVHRTDEGLLKGRIVEVEAYAGLTDPGSHAFRGVTPRTKVMFGPAGHAYVYLSYGIHHCLNVVTDTEGVAGAVLVRALEPLAGIPTMERKRGRTAWNELCNGPGKLCQAMGIILADNGLDLEGKELWLEDDGVRPEKIAASTRIGLSRGCDLPYRFYLPGHPALSPGRPSRAT